MRSKGLEPYAYRWDRTHTANQLQDLYRNLGDGEELNSEEDHVTVAGRIVARRAFGKLAFFTLRDDSGTIQVSSPLFSFVLLFLFCCIVLYLFQSIETGLCKRKLYRFLFYFLFMIYQ